MRSCVCYAVLLSLGWLAAVRAEPPQDDKPQPTGAQARVPWTSSHVVGTPEPPAPYRVQRVFERLPLAQPLFLTHEPETGRLLVVQLPGRILSFANQSDVDASDLFLDAGEDAYSLAFDPRYADNRFVYVFSNGPRDAQKKRNHITRYEVNREMPRRCDPASAHLILEYESNGHNGGDLAFGPDGYLYISSGDGTSDSDTNVTGQDLSDLTSAIIRIDVNASAQEQPYKIPPDNPFVDRAGARGEIWAYGLRNPWRIAFDRDSGRLWVADVGQDVREMVYVISRGDNCGWSVEEGGAPFHTLRTRGPTPIVPPVVFHTHSESRSITGGIVYRGDRLPDLRGAYIYGDYATGKIWGLRYDGRQITWQRELADTALQIVSFGADAAGEMYIVDYLGSLYRLEPHDAPPQEAVFPRRLSDTGLFASVARHEPAAGVIPYEVNSPLWSDGAKKERLLALPGTTQIQFTESRGWNFPDDAMAVKTFSFEMKPGETASRRRIETRLLVRQQGEWAGYSYQWNDEQTDALLVPALGADCNIMAPDDVSGELRAQAWHFPSRAECMVCHTRAANYVLGLSALQMNRAHRYHDGEENQLAVLERWGMFRDPLPKRPADLPALPDPRDTAVPVAERARSYLHANCAHCHVSAGGGNARLELEFTTPLAKMNLVGEKPLHDRFGMPEALLVAPGGPDRSLLLERVRTTQRGRMPPLASSVVDARGVNLLGEWIAGLPLLAGADETPPPAP